MVEGILPWSRVMARALRVRRGVSLRDNTRELLWEMETTEQRHTSVVAAGEAGARHEADRPEPREDDPDVGEREQQEREPQHHGRGGGTCQRLSDAWVARRLGLGGRTARRSCFYSL